MMRRPLLIALALLATLIVPSPAQAKEPLVPVSLPVLGSELNRGTGSAVASTPIPLRYGRTIDGDISDWVGRPSRYGGTSVYSGGEYVYQDYLFDAFGADNGEDVDRNGELETLSGVVPETYRLEAASRYLAGELDAPPPIAASTNYGDLGPLFTADLEEFHMTGTAAGLAVLARTTSLTATNQTAVLLLFDTAPGTTSRQVGFNSGLVTSRAERAVLLAGTQGVVRDLTTGKTAPITPGTVATNPDGFTNAIEAVIPYGRIGVQPATAPVVLSVATGPYDTATGGFANTGLPSNIANVAFRSTEPVREWMERQQAFDLFDHTIDRYFATADLVRARTGGSQRWAPGPGYHERTFVSSPTLAHEGGREGLWQHYGLYLPKAFDDNALSPLQFWLHWRGGTAHSAGAATPRIFRDLGDAYNTIVVSPRGRGTSSWYVGASHADILEVWDDVMGSFNIDRNRVYLAGHSMGGWGSFLFSVLYPDRFAAGLPASPPATQGAWTGLDFPGCDNFQYQEYTPCYISANDGRPRDQHYLRMLGNLRNVPLAIYQGVEDELVPYPGVLRHHIQLLQLGYRHRLYTYLTQEHYGPPAWDQWANGAEYLHSFVRNPNPPRVTYRRDMPFERAVEELRTDGGTFSYDFDSAYWMSELTPANLSSGFANFDGVSLALDRSAYLGVPEAYGPASLGQTGPYLMTGLAWVKDPSATVPPKVNAFTATLGSAAAVRLDLPRMSISTAGPVNGTVTTDRALELRLAGPWTGTPTVSTATGTLASSLAGGVLTIQLPAGTTAFTISS